MSFRPPNAFSLSLGSSFLVLTLGSGARTPTETGVEEDEVEATARESVEVGGLS